MHPLYSMLVENKGDSNIPNLNNVIIPFIHFCLALILILVVLIVYTFRDTAIRTSDAFTRDTFIFDHHNMKYLISSEATNMSVPPIELVDNISSAIRREENGIEIKDNVSKLRNDNVYFKLNDLRRQNRHRIIIGHLNINSVL